jgi:hypothetical protein
MGRLTSAGIEQDDPAPRNGDLDEDLRTKTQVPSSRPPTFDDYRLVLARIPVVMMAVALLLIGCLVLRLSGIASHPGLFKIILVLGTFLVINRRSNVASGPAPASRKSTSRTRHRLACGGQWSPALASGWPCPCSFLAPSGIVAHGISSKPR